MMGEVRMKKPGAVYKVYEYGLRGYPSRIAEAAAVEPLARFEVHGGYTGYEFLSSKLDWYVSADRAD
jgi:hypothetical protein